MEKKYLNELIIKEKSFDNGGSILRVSIKVNDLIEKLKEIEKETGWANICIAERQTPSDKGVTHYAYEDEWKPKEGFKSNTDNKMPF